MSYIEATKEPYLPAYSQIYDPRTAYAVGNRDIGLLFGQRARLSMMWQMHTTVKSEVVLHDELGVDHLLGEIKDIVNLSFTFDPMSYPIVGVEVDREDFKGIEVYRFNNYGGDVNDKELLLSLADCKTPKLVPTNISDLGSIVNQPLLIYVDETGKLSQRSMKTNFTVLVPDTSVIKLDPTDELRRAGITTTGKIQIEISKLKPIV